MRLRVAITEPQVGDCALASRDTRRVDDPVQVFEKNKRYTKALQRAMTPLAALPEIANGYLLTCGPPDAAAVARAEAVREPPPRAAAGSDDDDDDADAKDIPAPAAAQVGFGFGFGWDSLIFRHGGGTART